jgi:fucokinase
MMDYLIEIRLLQRQGVLPDNVLIVEDPCLDLGSGGSTLNALLVLVEHLCAQCGFTVLNESVFIDSRLLIIHFVSLNSFRNF